MTTVFPDLCLKSCSLELTHKDYQIYLVLQRLRIESITFCLQGLELLDIVKFCLVSCPTLKRVRVHGLTDKDSKLESWTDIRERLQLLETLDFDCSVSKIDGVLSETSAPLPLETLRLTSILSEKELKVFERWPVHELWLSSSPSSHWHSDSFEALAKSFPALKKVALLTQTRGEELFNLKSLAPLIHILEIHNPKITSSVPWDAFENLQGLFLVFPLPFAFPQMKRVRTLGLGEQFLSQKPQDLNSIGDFPSLKNLHLGFPTGSGPHPPLHLDVLCHLSKIFPTLNFLLLFSLRFILPLQVTEDQSRELSQMFSQITRIYCSVQFVKTRLLSKFVGVNTLRLDGFADELSGLWCKSLLEQLLQLKQLSLLFLEQLPRTSEVNSFLSSLTIALPSLTVEKTWSQSKTLFD